jgi:hypothetical protein
LAAAEEATQRSLSWSQSKASSREESSQNSHEVNALLDYHQGQNFLDPRVGEESASDEDKSAAHRGKCSGRKKKKGDPAPPAGGLATIQEEDETEYWYTTFATTEVDETPRGKDTPLPPAPAMVEVPPLEVVMSMAGPPPDICRGPKRMSTTIANILIAGGPSVANKAAIKHQSMSPWIIDRWGKRRTNDAWGFANLIYGDISSLSVTERKESHPQAQRVDFHTRQTRL